MTHRTRPGPFRLWARLASAGVSDLQSWTWGHRSGAPFAFPLPPTSSPTCPKGNPALSDSLINDTDRQVLGAYVKLWRSSHAVEVAAHRHLAEFGLTVSQFAVLEAAYHLGPLSQRQLAAKILRSSGNLTMVIDNLERDGLVRRERSDLDRRVTTVHLTPDGRDLIETVLPRHAAGVRKLFGALDPAEIEELARLTRKLGLAASAGAAPGAGKAAASSLDYTP